MKTYLGLNPETDSALQMLRMGYSAIHAGKHLGDERMKRAGRRQLEAARRMARDSRDN